MENREIKRAEAIRAGYTERKKTKLNELIELDRKVKRPAETFAYTFGTIGALVLGTGMSFAMKVIGASLSFVMPLGIAVGVVGIAMVSGNYFLYKKILVSRKKKYAAEILKLSDEIINA
ncbi:MAG: dihydropteridine reductase [Clostridia bacterium]|nr:dihydropteridine reductase [Clostridia bacterium]